MNIKTLAAASVIAFLPATAMATITVNTEGVDGVQLNSLVGSGASTSDVTGGVSVVVVVVAVVVFIVVVVAVVVVVVVVVVIVVVVVVVVVVVDI